jgi:hypothetical protein
MKKKDVLKAAIEFNEVVPLQEPVNVKESDFSALCKNLYESLQFIEKGDVFTPKTLQTFKLLRESAEGEIETEKESKKSKSVEVGTTVEMDINTNEIKKVKVMSKKEKGAKNAQVENAEIIAVVLNPGVTKDELVELVKTEKVFKSAKKELLGEKNYMVFKKKMREVFPEADVAAIKETMTKVERATKTKPKMDPLTEAITHADKSELKSICKENEKFEGFEWKPLKKDVEAWRIAMLEHIAPKAKSKAKAKAEVKIDPETEVLINSVKSATKVKQLKKIAKAEDRFDWKAVKKMEFEEMQTAMLAVLSPVKVKAKKEIKMIPNPLIETINEFEKTKKLKAWAEGRKEFVDVKIKKKMDCNEAKALLVEAIPAEVKPFSSHKNTVSVRNSEERQEFVKGLIKEKKYTRPELMKMLQEEFPGQDKAHSNMLSEIKNENYIGKYKLLTLVDRKKVDKDGIYRFEK